MPTSSRGASEVLTGLVQRGLVSKNGSSYQLTTTGRDSVRRRKAAYAPIPAPRPASSAQPAATRPAGVTTTARPASTTGLLGRLVRRQAPGPG